MLEEDDPGAKCRQPNGDQRERHVLAERQSGIPREQDHHEYHARSHQAPGGEEGPLGVPTGYEPHRRPLVPAGPTSGGWARGRHVAMVYFDLRAEVAELADAPG